MQLIIFCEHLVREWSLFMGGGSGGISKIACTQNAPPSTIANYIFMNPLSEVVWFYDPFQSRRSKGGGQGSKDKKWLGREVSFPLLISLCTCLTLNIFLLFSGRMWDARSWTSFLRTIGIQGQTSAKGDKIPGIPTSIFPKSQCKDMTLY